MTQQLVVYVAQLSLEEVLSSRDWLPVDRLACTQVELNCHRLFLVLNDIFCRCVSIVCASQGW